MKDKDHNDISWWLILVIMVLVIGGAAYYMHWKTIYDNHVWLKENPNGQINNMNTGEIYQNQWPE